MRELKPKQVITRLRNRSSRLHAALMVRVFCDMRLFAVVLLNLAAKPIIEGALLLQFQLCGGRGVDDRKARGRQPVWSLRAAFAFGHSVNDAFGKGDVRVVI